MPRVKRGLEEFEKPRHPRLAKELAAELKQSRESGQPFIEEMVFPRTNNVRVTVLWDKWARIPVMDRSSVIRQAYEQAEGKEFQDRITLAIGLTIPEASKSELLPYKVEAILRKGDPVTPKQCARAMVAQGASQLFDGPRPRLLLATLEEAEACVKRLIADLPDSEPVWVITKEDRPTGLLSDDWLRGEVG